MRPVSDPTLFPAAAADEIVTVGSAAVPAETISFMVRFNAKRALSFKSITSESFFTIGSSDVELDVEVGGVDFSGEFVNIDPFCCSASKLGEDPVVLITTVGSRCATGSDLGVVGMRKYLRWGATNLSINANLIRSTTSSFTLGKMRDFIEDIFSPTPMSQSKSILGSS